MFPTIIDLGVHDLPLLGETHLVLPSYGIIFALGVVAAWIWFVKRARKLQIPDDLLFNLCFYSVLAGLLGAKVTLVFVDLPFYLENPGEIIGLLRSAGVLIGGVAAGAATGIWYCRRRNLPIWKLADAAAAPIALAMAIGRLGCFAAGCCYGVETESGFCAVTFTDPDAHARTGVPLHVPLVPVQLIQMSNDLLLAAVLTALYRLRKLAEGQVFWIYVVLYSAARFIIEFFRGDSLRGVWFNGLLSTSQILSMTAALAGIAFLAYLGRRSRPER